MSNFDEKRYMKIRENQMKIVYGMDHGKIVENIMKIQEWQLKRISEIVDYAYENIPLYHKKYSEIGYRKGMIKTWEDYEKLPILYKNELIEGFPNEIVKDIEDFNLSTRSSGSSGQFVTFKM